MNTRKLVILSLLIALALGLSFLETLIPAPFPVPGAKLGLTNIVTVFILYRYSFSEAATVSLLRVFLAGFLFSTMSGILYALSGAVVSLLVMGVLVHFEFPVLITSTIGGISHNFGQLILATVVTQTPALFVSYMGPLFILGALTGVFVGMCAKLLLRSFENIKHGF